jgi:hypothetical protein
MSNYVEAGTSWIDKVRASQAARAEAAAAAAPQVPASKEGSANSKSDHDDSVKQALKRIPMLDFYRKNFNPKAERQLAGDEINVSCFNHIFHGNGDLHPQFNINQSKNVYTCHGCKINGDMLDLFANLYGLADADLRCPDDAVDEVVRRAGAEYLKAETYINAKGERVMALPDALPGSDDEDFDRVTGFPTFNMGSGAAPFAAQSLDFAPLETPVEPENTEVPTLNWRELLDPNGFSYAYVNYACADDSIEEFHVYNAFLALGFTAGRNLKLRDGRAVWANAFICDMGASGSGKSSAARILTDVLAQAMPYKKESALGVRIPPEAGSGESIIDSFQQKVLHPANPSAGQNKPYAEYLNDITALLNYDELSSLMNRIMRTGNTIEGVLQGIFDCKDSVGTKSRTAGEVEALRPYGSMLTTSQPARIAELVSKEQVGSGFASRIIYVFGKEKRQSAFTPVLPPTAHLADRLKDIRAWAQKAANTLRFIEWEPDAKERYEQFHRDVMSPTLQNDSNRDLTNRLYLMMKKHIFWLCLDVQSPVVTLAIVERGIKFWDYLYSCYKTVGGQMMKTAVGEREEEILNGLKRSYNSKGKWPTKSELRKNHLGRNKWSLNDLDLYLKQLVTHGHVEEVPPEPGKGNRFPRYRVPAE